MTIMENKELTDIVNSKNRFNIGLVLDEDSNKIPSNLGYFGKYTLIKLKGKKAIVFTDIRDSIVKLITYWFDDILYNIPGFDSCWDGDYRFNHDKPIIVKENGLYNLVEPHTNNLLLKEWCKSIETKWTYKKEIGYNYFVNAITEKGTEIIVFSDGSTVIKNHCTKENIENVLKFAKSLTINEIQTLWIDKNFPCEFIRGLEYKGSISREITSEKATELLKTHHDFNSMFNSAEWIISNGQVKLLFREYADSDYD